MIRTRRLAKVLSTGLILILLVGGVTLLVTSFIPFDPIKGMVDALARDGEVETFTPAVYGQVSQGARLAGLVLLAGGGGAYAARRRLREESEKALVWLSKVSLSEDARQLKVFLWPERLEGRYLMALGAITILAGISRGMMLSQPMGHDEAYTFLAFAARPLRYVIGDYHLPNNHVLHTLLVYLVYHLFGNQPWILRLPAYAAGVLSVPAVYLLGRAMYNRPAGLLSAALVAAAPILIRYSTSARGYTLLILITLLALTLAVYLKDNKNLAGWGLFALLCALGFYTLPTMLYPFGMMAAWLGLAAMRKDVSPEYGGAFWRYLLASAAGVALLTALLYTPIFVFSGIQAVSGNQVVSALDWPVFWEEIRTRIPNTWQEWNLNVPPAISAISVAGAGAAVIFHRQLTGGRASLFLAAAVWLPAVVVAQRVAPWPRVWLFLLPIYLVWASAGLVFLIQKAGQITRRRTDGDHFFLEKSYLWLAAAVLVPLLSSGLVATSSEYRYPNPGAEEQTALFLKEYLQAGDVVLATPAIDIQVRYYLRQHGAPDDYFFDVNREGGYERAVALVSQRYGETLEEVVERQRLARAPAVENAQPVETIGHITIYPLASP